MRQRMIREAVRKFSESVRLPSVDDIYSMDLDSKGEELTFRDGLHGAVGEPGKHASGKHASGLTKTTSVLVPPLSPPCTPPRVGRARVVDTNDDVIWANQLGREARGRVEEENRSHLRKG
jgi:hypothetical protein